jgi:hypothetical protein
VAAAGHLRQLHSDLQRDVPRRGRRRAAVTVEVWPFTGSGSFTAMVVLRQGIYDFVVHSVTLGSPGIVVTQQQPTA